MILALFFLPTEVLHIGRPRKDAADTTAYDATPTKNQITIDAGGLNPKQVEFWKSKAYFTCYGGAKGGGKSHVMRLKAVEGCLQYPGMKILLLRRQYKDLLKNHIEPLKTLLPVSVATYNGSTQTMYFCNGSTITFGHYNYDSSSDNYNGQEFDWIMLDEATQFTYEQFRFLGGCLRGVNRIPKRFYLTCNPGGVGHRWVKRLFIDREFVHDSPDPEDDENPDDYKFIFAKVEDNIAMQRNDPEGYKHYLASLKQMPEKIREAYRHGIWDDLGGAYFSEFKTSTHVIKPFIIPKEWRRYRAFDYGLDMFACYWVAVDFHGRCYVYREFCQKQLIVPDAAQEIHNNTAASELIDITFAPPDMWNKQSIDGKCAAETFMLNDVAIVKVNNNRVQGHMQIKEMLAPYEDYDDEGNLKPEDEWRPQLLFFDNCKHIIEDLAAIQTDDDNPNDCAKEPHDITHSVDGLRYFCISRTMPAIKEAEQTKGNRYADDREAVEDYEEYMTGSGEISASYIGA